MIASYATIIRHAHSNTYVYEVFAYYDRQHSLFMDYSIKYLFYLVICTLFYQLFSRLHVDDMFDVALYSTFY